MRRVTDRRRILYMHTELPLYARATETDVNARATPVRLEEAARRRGLLIA
jgi:hypothetical protein